MTDRPTVLKRILEEEKYDLMNKSRIINKKELFYWTAELMMLISNS